ncbi:MAG TPA: DNA ligase, partial [Phycisphaerales bacterium]|nr:DNA ligase [Phycisphaerales bacterium]
MQKIFKYPRTNHLAGSRLGPGDEDLEQIPLNQLKGRHVVIEEKLDGANCAFSFDSEGL